MSFQVVESQHDVKFFLIIFAVSESWNLLWYQYPQIFRVDCLRHSRTFIETFFSFVKFWHISGCSKTYCNFSDITGGLATQNLPLIGRSHGGLPNSLLSVAQPVSPPLDPANLSKIENFEYNGDPRILQSLQVFWLPSPLQMFSLEFSS